MPACAGVDAFDGPAERGNHVYLPFGSGWQDFRAVLPPYFLKKVHSPGSRPLSKSIYENEPCSRIPDSRMHSPMFDTAFPDSRAMTTDERTQIQDRGRKGAFTVPWNWIEVCFRELTPAWRSGAVKTDSLLDRSLKFISASQGVSTAASSTAPLTTWRVFAVFSVLIPRSTRSMQASMMVLPVCMELKMPRPKPQESIYRH